MVPREQLHLLWCRVRATNCPTLQLSAKIPVGSFTISASKEIFSHLSHESILQEVAGRVCGAHLTPWCLLMASAHLLLSPPLLPLRAQELELESRGTSLVFLKMLKAHTSLIQEIQGYMHSQNFQRAAGNTLGLLTQGWLQHVGYSLGCRALGRAARLLHLNKHPKKQHGGEAAPPRGAWAGAERGPATGCGRQARNNARLAAK